MDAERARELLGKERRRIERALAEQAGGGDGELTTVDQHLGDQGTELYNDEFEAGITPEDRVTQSLISDLHFWRGSLGLAYRW